MDNNRQDKYRYNVCVFVCVYKRERERASKHLRCEGAKLLALRME